MQWATHGILQFSAMQICQFTLDSRVITCELRTFQWFDTCLQYFERVIHGVTFEQIGRTISTQFQIFQDEQCITIGYFRICR